MESDPRMSAVEARLSAVEYRQNKIEAMYLEQQAIYIQHEKLLMSVAAKIDRLLTLADRKEKVTE